MNFRKFVWDLFFPSGLLFVVTLFLVREPKLVAKIEPWLDTFLPMFFVLLTFIAWRFHRGRVVFAAATLGLAYAALATSLGGKVTPATLELLFHSLVLVIAFNFLLLAVMQDRGVFGKWGISFAGWIGIQGFVLFGAWARLAKPLDTFLRTPVLDGVLQFLPAFVANSLHAASTPQVVIATWLVAAAALAMALLWRRTHVEAGLFWALLASTFGLREFALNTSLQIYFALAGIILFFSVLEFSYALAYRDELTGLPARRALYETFKNLGSRYVIAMVDVDHFKRFNDRHGHDVGDQVLKLVASRLAKVGGGGQAFRYGGEEFSIVFAGRDLDDAVPHLEALREEIEESRFTLRSPARPKKKPKEKEKGSKVTRRIENNVRGRALGVTVSIGVAMADARGDDPEHVLKAADQALYRAKNAGRNFVFVQKNTVKRR